MLVRCDLIAGEGAEGGLDGVLNSNRVHQGDFLMDCAALIREDSLASIVAITGLNEGLLVTTA